ncbi:MAG: isoquinoline 1-oxidoreductase beta subunit [Bacteroidia bacterium]|jgi:isoquinoline 1-oxidoreductase beta subunit
MSISRRGFIVGSAMLGGGLWLGLSLRGELPLPNLRDGSFAPNAWLQITPSGEVIFQLPKSEMGQGIHTSLATIVGEELDYDPENMRVEHAGAHAAYMKDISITQLTGGSTSIATTWTPLREAGAAGRAMLIAAAAARWNINSQDCSTEPGVVINNDTAEQFTYGELAQEARLFSDVSYTLKPRSQYRWLGKRSPRLDRVEKSTGAARYGMDVQLPGMKSAVVVRPREFGATLASFKADKAQESTGVEAVFAIHAGVAVVAQTYWQARKAAALLEINWSSGPLADLDSATIAAQQAAVLDTETGHIALERGDTATKLTQAEQVITARYSAPFAHHSPMEPQNATALFSDKRCEIWGPSQAPDLAQAVAAYYAGIPRNNVTVNAMTLGGGFGRRGYVDYIGEAAAIAQKMPGIPVKLVWSREDDMQHDFYRPATLHELSGTLDDQGNMESWQHRLVSPSILKGLGVNMASAVLPAWIPLEISRSIGRIATSVTATNDATTAEGAKVAYAVPNLSVEQILHDSGVPIGFWRSVGFSHNCFVAESFVDEMAHAAQQDPLAFRLKHLERAPRYTKVLQLAAEKANWGSPAAGRFQGIAVVEPFSSYCAAVVEVSVADGMYTVERVVNAVDCGFVVNPDIVTAQIESAVIYGLSAAMKPAITIANGGVEQSNFHDAPVLRMNESPVIETYIVQSDEDPTGIGEIGLPAVAPALANALFVATGQRLRDLPLVLG